MDLDGLFPRPGHAVLVCGPAGAGKTTLALDLYEHCQESPAEPHCLLLVPNSRAVQELRRSLARRNPAGMAVRPRVMTFTSLAGVVLGCGQLRPASPLKRFHILHAVLRELHEEKTLESFGPIMDTPGLVTALQRTISELKRGAADPEHLTALPASGGRGATRDLLAVYRRYQQRLREETLCDPEGQLWLLREKLAKIPVQADSLAAEGLEHLHVIAADGFTDFTPTQRQVLALLCPHLRGMLITLPLDRSDARRGRLWQWTQRTADRLGDAFGDRLEMCSIQAPNPETAGLASLAGCVFDHDAQVSEPCTQIRVVAAPGVDAEVTAAARDVKRLLASGAEPRSIALLARSMETYRPAIQRIFPRCNIPVREAASPLSEIPIIRFVLELLALPGGNYLSRDVLAVLANSYFQPNALGPFDRTTAMMAERIIRLSNVLGGREAYTRAVRWVCQRVEADDEESLEPLEATLASDAEGIRSAGALLEALFQAVPARPDASSLQAMLDALSLRRAACGLNRPDLAARDLRALEALRSAILETPEEDLQPEILRASLERVSLPGPRREGVVDVLDVLDARTGQWDHVLLLGLSEGQFPAGLHDSALLGETQREEWIARGVQVDRRSDLTAREMLLFYLSITRARRSLLLSYQRSDAMGGAAAPGGFLLSYLRPMGGLDAVHQAGLVETVPLADFAPPPEHIASDDEAMRTAIGGLFDEHAPAHQAALGWASTHKPALLRTVGRGLWTLAQRWTRGEPTAYDGRMNDPALLDSLRRKYPDGVVFSASRLNTYARCPWQYFARYVLRLDPLAEPQARLEPTTKGTFCHNVLCRAMRRLADDIGQPLRLTGLDPQAIDEALEEAVGIESERFGDVQMPYPALWNIRREGLARELRDYLRECGEMSPGVAEAMHFELAFGFGEASGDLADEASSPAPALLETPAGQIRLRGRIDRLDHITSEFGEGMMVVDYKTGRPPSRKACSEGLDLQIPLYVHALRDMGYANVLGGIYQGVLGKKQKTAYAAIEPKRSDCWKSNEGFEDELQGAMAVVAAHITAMQQGQFDLAPRGNPCPFCPYRRICAFSPARQEATRVEENA